jgi:hypothetical protein
MEWRDSLLDCYTFLVKSPVFRPAWQRLLYVALTPSSRGGKVMRDYVMLDGHSGASSVPE